jgi:hypothetical protein
MLMFGRRQCETSRVPFRDKVTEAAVYVVLDVLAQVAEKG